MFIHKKCIYISLVTEFVLLLLFLYCRFVKSWLYDVWTKIGNWKLKISIRSRFCPRPEYKIFLRIKYIFIFIEYIGKIILKKLNSKSNVN